MNFTGLGGTQLRLDQYLVDNNYFPTKTKAQAIIMMGNVYINNQKATKAGAKVLDDDTIEVRGGEEKYVSRGGYKLEKAIEVFGISLEGKVAMDIGASTGGFSDCMLGVGAARVYCVDVGYGQLAWKIRNDERVVNFERTNIRYLEASKVDKLDFASVDVSFISLGLVLPKVYELLGERGECVCLIKPQFEAGREKVGKRGVVRDRLVHIEVIDKVIDIAFGLGFSVKGIDFSPIKGPQGNIEYLIYLKKGEKKSSSKDDEQNVSDMGNIRDIARKAVEKAWEML
ncbi:MAG: TlyA family RNA methyltransferase [Clostridiales bacterium]|jgi:23S rRNA (cytidine1920-2'-O)/16S rRNA (cytidine1409-2'-O)-methyltransferase|nr:TlyA family RNA methyltransferase [Clostridiales bacterium]